MPPLYDTFLVREPLRDDPFAVTHNPSDIPTLIEVYTKSIAYFTERHRGRAVERLQYELALLFVREQKWRKALRLLLPVYEGSSWRREGWWELLGLLREQVRDVAMACGDAQVVLRTEWEGMCDCFPRQIKKEYDFSRCLDGMEGLSSKPRVVVRAEESASCLSTTFCFGSSQGNVGELLPAQLAITSHAQRSTAPMVLSHIMISFDNGLKDIKIEHRSNENPSSSSIGNLHVFSVALGKESTTSELPSPTSSSRIHLLGTCDLNFSPGTTKAISVDLIPKDAGIVRVASITSTIKTDSFSIEHVVSEVDYMRQEDFWLESTKGTSRRAAGNEGSNEIRIHPKPPKVQIRIPTLRKEYLTDESVRLEVEITNEEDDDADVTLEARFLGQADSVPVWIWITNEVPASSEDPLSDKLRNSTSTIALGHISRSTSRKVEATFTANALPTEAVLEMKALYHVLGEPDTPISKVLIQDVIFDRPFEVDCDFQPCVDMNPWPSYFYPADIGEKEESAHGLRQLWHLNVRLASFSTEPLVIENIALEVLNVHDRASCKISNVPLSSTSNAIIGPNDFHESRFQIDTQKLDLDDRRSTAVQLQIQVCWRRKQSGIATTTATTLLPVQDLIIAFGEPRVLASAGPPQEESQAIPLEYTIENPSTHVLNFDLSMETSDDFAFSGPKAMTLNLVPVSRTTVRYNIVPLVRGKWITPRFRVLDTGFKQVLRVDATGGMRSDKKGASVWVDAEE
ncbi:MAG: hypothetical protein Q9209_004073 [Squamulea sp. 1 TL-2023]